MMEETEEEKKKRAELELLMIDEVWNKEQD